MTNLVHPTPQTISPFLIPPTPSYSFPNVIAGRSISKRIERFYIYTLTVVPRNGFKPLYILSRTARVNSLVVLFPPMSRVRTCLRR